MRENKCNGQDKVTAEQILERFEGVTCMVIGKKYVPDGRTSKHASPGVSVSLPCSRISKKAGEE